MMRQWNRVVQAPAQTPVETRGGRSTRGRKALLLAVLAAAGVISVQGGGAIAQSPGQASPATATRTTLEIMSRPAQAEASGRRATETILTAHVTDAEGAAVEDGAVSFESSSGALGSAMLGLGGEATIMVTSVPAAASGATASGALAVRAVYHPLAPSQVAAGQEAEAGQEPATRSGSASPVSRLVADATGVPDFTVTANPATVTATQGLSATSAITITPLNGFNEQITLSCSNLPAQATCTFSPVIESTAAGAFTSNLQLQTQGAAGVVSRVAPGPETPMTLAWLLPGVFALAGFAVARRQFAARTAMALLPALLLLGGGLGLAGCSARYGYNHHPPSVATGTLPGTYLITVAASGNNGSAVTEHDLTLTLQVQ